MSRLRGSHLPGAGARRPDSDGDVDGKGGTSVDGDFRFVSDSVISFHSNDDDVFANVFFTDDGDLVELLFHSIVDGEDSIFSNSTVDGAGNFTKSRSDVDGGLVDLRFIIDGDVGCLECHVNVDGDSVVGKPLFIVGRVVISTLDDVVISNGNVVGEALL